MKSSLYPVKTAQLIYFPDSGVTKYSIDNMSDHKIYPAFAANGDNYTPDSIHGLLDPGVIRMYTTEDAYWSSPAVNIGEGTELCLTHILASVLFVMTSSLLMELKIGSIQK